MAELRREPIERRWVVTAKDSSKGPADYVPYKPPYQLQEEEKPCPFCPGYEDRTPPAVYSLGSGGEAWSVRVVPNKFPFFRIEGGFDRRAEGMYDVMEAIGAHEIVVEAPEHDQNLATLDPKQIERILLAYKGRLVIIGVTSGIKAELNLALMMVKRQQIIGSVLRSRPVKDKGDIVAEFTRTALPKFADRTIVPIIEKVFTLDEVVEAHRMMEEDRHFGKIVIKVA